jgi:hypothetical protein
VELAIFPSEFTKKAQKHKLKFEYKTIDYTIFIHFLEDIINNPNLKKYDFSIWFLHNGGAPFVSCGNTRYDLPLIKITIK